MKISTIRDLLEAKVVCCEEGLGKHVYSACGSDMMSDVLAYVKDQAVLLTGLVNSQVIRTAEMIETMYTTWLIGFQRVHGVDKSHEYHKRICKAIAEHKAQEASDAMHDHLFDVLTKIKMDKNISENTDNKQ